MWEQILALSNWQIAGVVAAVVAGFGLGIWRIIKGSQSKVSAKNNSNAAGRDVNISQNSNDKSNSKRR
jgi:hypothetical protein